MNINLSGLKKFDWNKNLTGYIQLDGKPLPDKIVREVVEYGISKKYKYLSEIDNDKIREIANEGKEKE